MDADSDLELAEALAAGQVDALALLYDRYGALSYSVALRVLGDPGRAEDVVQDAFLKLWHSASRFDSHRGSLRTWVITAVRNRSIDYLRGRSAHERQEREIPVETEARGTGSDPWREVAASIERDVIKEAMASLPPEQRQAVGLAYFRGHRHRENAEMIRGTLSTVKGRVPLPPQKPHSLPPGPGV